jgi:hypothetical protein
MAPVICSATAEGGRPALSVTSLPLRQGLRQRPVAGVAVTANIGPLAKATAQPAETGPAGRIDWLDDLAPPTTSFTDVPLELARATPCTPGQTENTAQ